MKKRSRRFPTVFTAVILAAVLLGAGVTAFTTGSVPLQEDKKETAGEIRNQVEKPTAGSQTGTSAASASAATSADAPAATPADAPAATPAAASAVTPAATPAAASAVTPAATPTAAPAEEAEPPVDAIKGIVAIDPGHQGPSIDMSALEPDGPGSANMKAKATSGTTGRFTGIGEYELVMDISLLLREELELRGYEVVLTRENNETAISNSERAILANESGADIYLRIHANGAEDPSVSGALAMSPGYDNPYVSYLAAESEELALDILNSYCAKTGMASQGLAYTNTMTGINWSEIPVMILEMGYMTNEQDDNQMANAEFRDLMVQGIADGVDQWYAANPSPSEGQPRKMRGGRPVGENAAGSGDDTYPVTAEMTSLADQIYAGSLAEPEKAGETWGVTVIDLTGKQRAIGGDRRIKSASVLKLFIMAAVFDQIYMGVPEGETAAAAPIASGDAAAQAVSTAAPTVTPAAAADTAAQAAATTAPTATPSATTAPTASGDAAAQTDLGAWKTLLTDMITVSDNTAANTLVEKLGGGDFEAGRQWLNNWCRQHGYTGTSMGRRFLASDFTEDNYTTSDDCARLLASVYDGTCVCPPAAEQMLALLKGQTRLNKIPAGVAAYDVQTANKTGELADASLGFVENDAAIVWGKKKDYVLCTLSENVAANGAAITRISELSNTVYQRLNQ